MRNKIQHQMSLVETGISHPHAKEMQLINELLRTYPEIARLVHRDLVSGLSNPQTGRKGLMTADQVFRVLTIKQMNGFSYELLEFHISDSRTYREFCGFGVGDKVPSAKTIQRDIKKIQPETYEAINCIIVHHAAKSGVEKGRKVRIDCTVVETNIHTPTDSSLLEDCVRVLCRLTRQAKEKCELKIRIADHSRKAKKYALQILNARNNKQRLGPYKDLLKITRKCIGYANKVIFALENNAVSDVLAAFAFTQTLKQYIPLASQVISQTERRILHEESVPSVEKIVSIFEPHTDIIRKDRRDTLYGHKIVLTNSPSGLFTDLVIEKGNPADSTLAVKMVSRQESIYGRVPRQVVYDGAFSSNLNLSTIKEMGVKDAVFSKKRGMKISDMAKSTWVYKRLRDFRAGIEGMISYLKRCFGLNRCTWCGFTSFKSYAWASVVTANLLLLARHLIE